MCDIGVADAPAKPRRAHTRRSWCTWSLTAEKATFAMHERVYSQERGA